jgi:hypothetical protein
MGKKITVKEVMKVHGASRNARAYAFLYATFRRSEISASPVRDAIDCLVPFVSIFLQQTAGSQVDVSSTQEFLRKTFGFEIPLYALDQLLIDLSKRGALTYNRRTKIYISAGASDEYTVAREELVTDFDDISALLERFAQARKYYAQPSAGSWGQALIDFLKSSPERQELKTIPYKGALVSATTIETSLIGAFIDDLSKRAEGAFQKLLNIFMGVLVEEFIGSVSSIGQRDDTSKLVVFYDTSVLLRLLGCSGRLLRTATEELTRYLQDLGLEIKYLGGNEEELNGIVDAILHKKDSGLDIEGETADALSRGEVTITDLRMLQNSVAERLATWSIFRFDKLPSPTSLSAFHINEAGFQNFLLEEARKAGRNYNAPNRTNDASYLGIVMRLRRGMHIRDLLSAGFIFITSNKFLVNCARRYLVRERQLHQQDCPPMLHVGQVATIAWLMKDHKLSPERAGRDLLANCYERFGLMLNGSVTFERRSNRKWARSMRSVNKQALGSRCRRRAELHKRRRLAIRRWYDNSVAQSYWLVQARPPSSS